MRLYRRVVPSTIMGRERRGEGRGNVWHVTET